MSGRVVSGSLSDLVEASAAYENGDLAALAGLVASNTALWPALQAPTREERAFTRVYVNAEQLEVWVLGRREGHETGLHDHDGSAGAVCVVEGELAEDLLVGFSSETGIFLAPARRRTGEIFAFDGGRTARGRRPGRLRARIRTPASAHGALRAGPRRDRPPPRRGSQGPLRS